MGDGFVLRPAEATAEQQPERARPTCFLPEDNRTGRAGARDCDCDCDWDRKEAPRAPSALASGFWLLNLARHGRVIG